MKITKITTENISFTFNEDITLKNIRFKDKLFIKNISLMDIFYKQILNEYNFINNDEKFENAIKKSTWTFSYKAKRKLTEIFANGVFKEGKTKLKINFIIKTNDHGITITNMNNCTQKIIYGVTFKLVMPSKIVEYPFPLENNQGILKLTTKNPVIYKVGENVCKINSTYGKLDANQEKFTLSPTLYGKKREVFKAWSVYHNNKNFNVLSILFE